MDFCAKCGRKISKGVFCSECSYKIESKKEKPKNLQIKTGKTKPANYFEGILQLRTNNLEVLKKAIDFINLSLGKKNNAEIFIQKAVEYKNGIDFYFSDKRFMKNLADKLFNLFGGVLSLNPQLFSRDSQKSKDLFRLNILLKLPEYQINDIVAFENKIVKIIKFSKEIIGTCLNDNSKIKISYKEKLRLLNPKKTNISKIYPNIEVIHPETFQSEPLLNIPKNKISELKINQNVMVVVNKNAVYYLN